MELGYHCTAWEILDKVEQNESCRHNFSFYKGNFDAVNIPYITQHNVGPKQNDVAISHKDTQPKFESPVSYFFSKGSSVIVFTPCSEQIGTIGLVGNIVGKPHVSSKYWTALTDHEQVHLYSLNTGRLKLKFHVPPETEIATKLRRIRSATARLRRYHDMDVGSISTQEQMLLQQMNQVASMSDDFIVTTCCYNESFGIAIGCRTLSQIYVWHSDSVEDRNVTDMNREWSIYELCKARPRSTELFYVEFEKQGLKLFACWRDAKNGLIRFDVYNYSHKTNMKSSGSSEKSIQPFLEYSMPLPASATLEWVRMDEYAHRVLVCWSDNKQHLDCIHLDTKRAYAVPLEHVGEDKKTMNSVCSGCFLYNGCICCVLLSSHQVLLFSCTGLLIGLCNFDEWAHSNKPLSFCGTLKAPPVDSTRSAQNCDRPQIAEIVSTEHNRSMSIQQNMVCVSIPDIGCLCWITFSQFTDEQTYGGTVDHVVRLLNDTVATDFVSTNNDTSEDAYETLRKYVRGINFVGLNTRNHPSYGQRLNLASPSFDPMHKFYNEQFNNNRNISATETNGDALMAILHTASHSWALCSTLLSTWGKTSVASHSSDASQFRTTVRHSARHVARVLRLILDKSSGIQLLSQYLHNHLLSKNQRIISIETNFRQWLFEYVRLLCCLPIVSTTYQQGNTLYGNDWSQWMLGTLVNSVGTRVSACVEAHEDIIRRYYTQLQTNSVETTSSLNLLNTTKSHIQTIGALLIWTLTWADNLHSKLGREARKAVYLNTKLSFPFLTPTSNFYKMLINGEWPHVAKHLSVSSWQIPTWICVTKAIIQISSSLRSCDSVVAQQLADVAYRLAVLAKRQGSAYKAHTTNETDQIQVSVPNTESRQDVAILAEAFAQQHWQQAQSKAIQIGPSMWPIAFLSSLYLQDWEVALRLALVACQRIGENDASRATEMRAYRIIGIQAIFAILSSRGLEDWIELRPFDDNSGDQFLVKSCRNPDDFSFKDYTHPIQETLENESSLPRLAFCVLQDKPQLQVVSCTSKSTRRTGHQQNILVPSPTLFANAVKGLENVLDKQFITIPLREPMHFPNSWSLTTVIQLLSRLNLPSACSLALVAYLENKPCNMIPNLNNDDDKDSLYRSGAADTGQPSTTIRSHEKTMYTENEKQRTNYDCMEDIKKLSVSCVADMSTIVLGIRWRVHEAVISGHSCVCAQLIRGIPSLLSFPWQRKLLPWLIDECVAREYLVSIDETFLAQPSGVPDTSIPYLKSYMSATRSQSQQLFDTMNRIFKGLMSVHAYTSEQKSGRRSGQTLPITMLRSMQEIETYLQKIESLFDASKEDDTPKEDETHQISALNHFDSISEPSGRSLTGLDAAILALELHRIANGLEPCNMEEYLHILRPNHTNLLTSSHANHIYYARHVVFAVYLRMTRECSNVWFRTLLCAKFKNDEISKKGVDVECGMIQLLNQGIKIIDEVFDILAVTGSPEISNSTAQTIHNQLTKCMEMIAHNCTSHVVRLLAAASALEWSRIPNAESLKRIHGITRFEAQKLDHGTHTKVSKPIVPLVWNLTFQVFTLDTAANSSLLKPAIELLLGVGTLYQITKEHDEELGRTIQRRVRSICTQMESNIDKEVVQTEFIAQGKKIISTFLQNPDSLQNTENILQKESTLHKKFMKWCLLYYDYMQSTLDKSFATIGQDSSYACMVLLQYFEPKVLGGLWINTMHSLHGSLTDEIQDFPKTSMKENKIQETDQPLANIVCTTGTMSPELFNDNRQESETLIHTTQNVSSEVNSILSNTANAMSVSAEILDHADDTLDDILNREEKPHAGHVDNQQISDMNMLRYMFLQRAQQDILSTASVTPYVTSYADDQIDDHFDTEAHIQGIVDEIQTKEEQSLQDVQQEKKTDAEEVQTQEEQFQPETDATLEKKTGADEIQTEQQTDTEVQTKEEQVQPDADTQLDAQIQTQEETETKVGPQAIEKYTMPDKNERPSTSSHVQEATHLGAISTVSTVSDGSTVDTCALNTPETFVGQTAPFDNSMQSELSVSAEEDSILNLITDAIAGPLAISFHLPSTGTSSSNNALSTKDVVSSLTAADLSSTANSDVATSLSCPQTADDTTIDKATSPQNKEEMLNENETRKKKVPIQVESSTSPSLTIHATSVSSTLERTSENKSLNVISQLDTTQNAIAVQTISQNHTKTPIKPIANVSETSNPQYDHIFPQDDFDNQSIDSFNELILHGQQKIHPREIQTTSHQPSVYMPIHPYKQNQSTTVKASNCDSLTGISREYLQQDSGSQINSKKPYQLFHLGNTSHADKDANRPLKDNKNQSTHVEANGTKATIHNVNKNNLRQGSIHNKRAKLRQALERMIHDNSSALHKLHNTVKKSCEMGKDIESDTQKCIQTQIHEMLLPLYQTLHTGTNFTSSDNKQHIPTKPPIGTSSNSMEYQSSHHSVSSTTPVSSNLSAANVSQKDVSLNETQYQKISTSEPNVPSKTIETSYMSKADSHQSGPLQSVRLPLNSKPMDAFNNGLEMHSQNSTRPAVQHTPENNEENVEDDSFSVESLSFEQFKHIFTDENDVQNSSASPSANTPLPPSQDVHTYESDRSPDMLDNINKILNAAKELETDFSKSHQLLDALEAWQVHTVQESRYRQLGAINATSTADIGNKPLADQVDAVDEKPAFPEQVEAVDDLNNHTTQDERCISVRSTTAQAALKAVEAAKNAVAQASLHPTRKPRQTKRPNQANR